MKTKVMKLVAVCLAGALVAGSIYSPVDAAKKAGKKVTISGKKKVTMTVGAKKNFKANQKVKWSVKGKSVKIVKGKNAKTVTVQAKKKGSATLTAKKGNKKASVKIQVTKKAAANNKAGTTDVTKLNDVYFYKVTKVSGNTLTLQATRDNKTYTTVVKSDLPIWRDDAVIQASSIQVGEYFRCCPFSYKQGSKTVTTYAAMVISERAYQFHEKYRNDPVYYTESVATFYVMENPNYLSFDVAAYPNGKKFGSISIDEDVPIVVNGKIYDNAGQLSKGKRVLIQVDGEIKSNAENPLSYAGSVVAY